MNAELTEIARRFVACSGWVWLVGMAYVSTDPDDKMRHGRLGLAPDGGTCFRSVEDWYHGDEADERDPSKFAEWGWLPDLDDPVTAAGILPVVRRAWGIPHLGIWGNPSLSPGVRFTCGEANGRVIGAGPSELLALLAALEAAPK